ncbi:MAG: hypothetical protein QXQ87_00890, partial [Halobacteria archaeon]
AQEAKERGLERAKEMASERGKEMGLKRAEEAKKRASEARQKAAEAGQKAAEAEQKGDIAKARVEEAKQRHEEAREKAQAAMERLENAKDRAASAKERHDAARENAKEFRENAKQAHERFSQAKQRFQEFKGKAIATGKDRKAALEATADVQVAAATEVQSTVDETAAVTEETVEALRADSDLTGAEQQEILDESGVLEVAPEAASGSEDLGAIASETEAETTTIPSEPDEKTYNEKKEKLKEKLEKLKKKHAELQHKHKAHVCKVISAKMLHAIKKAQKFADRLELQGKDVSTLRAKITDAIAEAKDIARLCRSIKDARGVDAIVREVQPKIQELRKSLQEAFVLLKQQAGLPAASPSPLPPVTAPAPAPTTAPAPAPTTAASPAAAASP